MKPKHVVVSLPVQSIDRSRRFYETLDFRVDRVGDGMLSIELAGLTLFLAQADKYAEVTKAANAKPNTEGSTSECLISCAISTKDEVDSVLALVKQVGGTPYPTATRDHFGHKQYVGYFTDPDGHLWELVWNIQ